MPLSDDPGRRARQLANLPNLAGRPSAASWKPGDAPHLQHGARTRSPGRSPEWSPAVRKAIADLEQRVGDELRDGRGELHGWALPSVEAVAVLRIALWRLDRFIADQDARGALKPADLELQSKIAGRYSAGLYREGLALTARLEAARSTFDLAQEMARLDDEERGRDGR